MLAMKSPSLRLRPIKLIFIALALSLACILFWTRSQQDPFHLFDDQLRWLHDHHSPARPELPPEYEHHSQLTDDDWCLDRFSTKYLTNARDAAVTYCKPGSATNITCFWSQTSTGRNDAMCYARGAAFDAPQHRFKLGCGLEDMTKRKGVPAFPEALPVYWYETGPGWVVSDGLELDEKGTAEPTTRTSILIKREGAQNPWHSLLEIMSMSLTLDVLRIAVDNQTNEPFIDKESGANAQIVILDNHEDGPYFDLWQMFAKLPVRRISDLGPDEPPSNVVIPLSGGSNTLWQGDWDELPCHDGDLVRTFVGRALEHYKVPTPDAQETVTVTYIQRTNTRKLIDEQAHVDALRRAIPHMVLEVVDFEKLTFPEQLEVARRSDVLLGVHGAGLAHTLFLRPGSAVVEIQPEGFNHQGFHNLAQLLDLGYFRTHADLQDHSGGGDTRWQMEAVQMDQAKLIDIVAMAVKSVSTRQGRSYDTI
ncbi:hypothetical protein ACO1O0_004851 [Amphichorda felina]